MINKTWSIFQLLIIILFLNSNIYAEINSIAYWQNMTKEDLNTTKKLMLENNPKASLIGDHYSFWLESGYQTAINMSKQVDSFAGYISVLRFYLNGFQDFHTEVIPLLSMINPSDKWPGFIVGYRNGKVKVLAHSDNPKNWKALPAIGDELIECDNLTVEHLLEKNIALFYPLRKNETSTLIEHTPKLLVWDQNPYAHQLRECLFLDHGKVKLYNLDWQVALNTSPLYLGESNFQQKMINVAFGNPPEFAISAFGNDGIWISIPIFASGIFIQGNITDKWLTDIAKKLPSYRNKKILVFDLRGNTGGDPKFSNPIIEALYGSDYLKSLGESFIWNQPKKILFIANTDNLSHMVQSNSPQNMINGMKQAILDGKKTYIYQDNSHSNNISNKKIYLKNPVRAKIILLTGLLTENRRNFRHVAI